ncbi:MAG: hypothetical protein JWS12_261 [Candidatus Saccharibacteria bacterium]|nr:hypothetical protein [Candidatus Saccharibacteria bacterium]
MASPNLSRTCNENCVIDNPDMTYSGSPIVLGPEGQNATREEAFFSARMVLARILVVYGTDKISTGEHDTEGQEVFTLARECLQRIKNGDCGTYILNTEQYPGYPEALISYEDAKNRLGIKEGENDG